MSGKALVGDIQAVLERVMQHHLPVRMPDESVMCLCHATGNKALFEGPVFHRRHVARLQVEALERLGLL